MKQLLSSLKPYLRWVIFGGTLFFLAKTFKDRAAEVAAIRIDASSWTILAIAFFVTLLAHIWSGWVWTWILREFNQPVPVFWALRVYLQTNIAKYLPGNVWHFSGRIWALREAGVSLSVATLSVLLEPVLMAAAALLMAMGTGAIASVGIWQVLGLAGVLIGVHPRILNRVMLYVSKLKGSKAVAVGSPRPEQELNPCGVQNPCGAAVRISRYPLLPLVGELGFLLLRGMGFLLTVQAMGRVDMSELLLLLGSFSFAWLLGLVVPGAPGGIGVFESTAIALLDDYLPAGVLLGAIAFYRLISVLAEAVGAGLAWLLVRVR